MNVINSKIIAECSEWMSVGGKIRQDDWKPFNGLR